MASSSVHAEPAHPRWPQDVRAQLVQPQVLPNLPPALRVQMWPHKGPGLNFPGWYPRLPEVLWDSVMIPIKYLLNV